jgi:hypothetical protein
MGNVALGGFTTRLAVFAFGQLPLAISLTLDLVETRVERSELDWSTSGWLVIPINNIPCINTRFFLHKLTA